MKLLRTLVALAACFATSQTFAQSKMNLSGTIIEKDTNEPVMAATVRVMLLPDSSMVDGMYTDTVGVFRLVDIKEPKHGKRSS